MDQNIPIYYILEYTSKNNNIDESILSTKRQFSQKSSGSNNIIYNIPSSPTPSGNSNVVNKNIPSSPTPSGNNNVVYKNIPSSPTPSGNSNVVNNNIVSSPTPSGNSNVVNKNIVSSPTPSGNKCKNIEKNIINIENKSIKLKSIPIPSSPIPSSPIPSSPIPSSPIPSGNSNVVYKNIPSSPTPSGNNNVVYKNIPSSPTPSGNKPSGNKPSSPTPSGNKCKNIEENIINIEESIKLKSIPTPSGNKPSSSTPSGNKPSSPTPSGNKPSSPTPSGNKPSSPTPSGNKPSSSTPSGNKPFSPTPSGNKCKNIEKNIINIEENIIKPTTGPAKPISSPTTGPIKHIPQPKPKPQLQPIIIPNKPIISTISKFISLFSEYSKYIIINNIKILPCINVKNKICEFSKGNNILKNVNKIKNYNSNTTFKINHIIKIFIVLFKNKNERISNIRNNIFQKNEINKLSKIEPLEIDNIKNKNEINKLLKIKQLQIDNINNKINQIYEMDSKENKIIIESLDSLMNNNNFIKNQYKLIYVPPVYDDIINKMYEVNPIYNNKDQKKSYIYVYINKLNTEFDKNINNFKTDFNKYILPTLNKKTKLVNISKRNIYNTIKNKNLKIKEILDSPENDLSIVKIIFIIKQLLELLEKRASNIDDDNIFILLMKYFKIIINFCIFMYNLGINVFNIIKFKDNIYSIFDSLKRVISDGKKGFIFLMLLPNSEEHKITITHILILLNQIELLEKIIPFLFSKTNRKTKLNNNEIMSLFIDKNNLNLFDYMLYSYYNHNNKTSLIKLTNIIPQSNIYNNEYFKKEEVYENELKYILITKLKLNNTELNNTELNKNIIPIELDDIYMNNYLNIYYFYININNFVHLQELKINSKEHIVNKLKIIKNKP